MTTVWSGPCCIETSSLCAPVAGEGRLSGPSLLLLCRPRTLTPLTPHPFGCAGGSAVHLRLRLLRRLSQTLAKGITKAGVKTEMVDVLSVDPQVRCCQGGV